MYFSLQFLSCSHLLLTALIHSGCQLMEALTNMGCMERSRVEAVERGLESNGRTKTNMIGGYKAPWKNLDSKASHTAPSHHHYYHCKPDRMNKF